MNNLAQDLTWLIAANAGIRALQPLPLPGGSSEEARQHRDTPLASGAHPAAGETQSEVTFSSGMQLIRVLEEREMIGARVAAPGHLRIPAAASDTQTETTVAQHLRKAVEASGVFYESHVAQWAHGRKSLEAVRDEAAQRWPASANAPQSQALADSTSPPREIAGQHDAVLAQQLNFLRSGELAWQIQAWPGADIVLRFDEESTASQDGEAAVTTTVEMNLPHLGHLSARMQIVAGTLAVALTPDAPDSITRNDLHALTVRLGQIAGVRLNRITLDHHANDRVNIANA